MGVRLIELLERMNEMTDAERMDWLEKRGSVNLERVKRLRDIDKPAVYEVTPWNDDSFEGKTLRDAIDKAMAESI